MLSIFIVFPILSTVAVSIVVINLLTLSTIFTSPQLLKPGNYPIIGFLMTALVQGFVVVPAYCIKIIGFDFTSKWICDVFRFPYFVCAHMLTLNLVLVCIDRIIAIKLPLRYDALVTRISMLFAIGTEIFAVVIVDLLPFANGSEDDECVYTPWPSWSITVVVITVLLPIVFLTLTYAWIWLIAFRVADDPPNRKCDERTSLKKKITARVTKILELRATKTATLLVGVFVLCWGPIAVYHLVENLCGHCITTPFTKKAQTIVSFLVKVFSFASSIISPFVYCWRTREFQREFRKNLTRRHWRAARIALSFMKRAKREQGPEKSAAVECEWTNTATKNQDCKEAFQNLEMNVYGSCTCEGFDTIDANNSGRQISHLHGMDDEYAYCMGNELDKQITLDMEDGLQTTVL